MAGVTKDEVQSVLAAAAKALWASPWTADGGQRAAYDALSTLDDTIERDGLDPGPHPSLKAIEGRLDSVVTRYGTSCGAKPITYGDWKTLKAILDDLRSGKIPPAPTEAEVEALRAENDKLARVAVEGAAEAERLRGLLHEQVAEIGRLAGCNQRLFDELQAKNREIAMRAREREAMKAEIARLKDEAKTTETANRADPAAVKAYAATVAGLEADLAVRQAEVAALLDANGRQAKRIADLESKAVDSYVEKGQAKAWLAVSRAITEVDPQAFGRERTGLESAVRAVRDLAAARDERDALRDECEELKEKSFADAAEIERLKGPEWITLIDTAPIVRVCDELRAKLDDLGRDLEAQIAATAR